MPETCKIRVESLGGGPPYIGQRPTKLLVHGRAQGCAEVKVTVRNRINTITLFEKIVTVTDDGNQAPGFDGTAYIWQTEFDINVQLFEHLLVSCDRELWIEATCPNNNDCDSDAALHVITCKQQPDNNNVPDDDDDWWIWDWPPAVFCPYWGKMFAAALFAALESVVVAAVFPSTIAYLTVTILFASAGAAYWMWYRWCFPDDCKIGSVIIWAFKLSIIAGIPFSLISEIGVSNANGLLGLMVVLMYGGYVAYKITRQLKLGCPIPSSTTHISNLPF